MANLASVIMEGALVSSRVDMGNYDYSETAIAESSYSDSAVASLFTDIMEAEQAWMVADVVGAATVIRENTLGNQVNPVAVTEGIIKSGIEKIKSAFQKFIAKIKEYYKRVIDWFKAMFSNGEDFAKNFGDMIKKKAQKVKDFEYTGWNYTADKGDAKVLDIRNKVEKEMQTIIGEFDFAKEAKTKKELAAHLRSKGTISKDFKEDDATPASEVVEKYLEDNFKYSDVSELRSELTELYHDGDTSKQKIKNFEANSVDSMVKFLKESTKTISKFENQLKTYEEKTNKVISKLNGFESEKDEEGGDNLVANASYLSSIMTAYLNVYKAPCEVQIAVYKAMASDYLGTLKKFYNYKGNAIKESADVYDLDGYAMLESSVLEGSKADSEPEGDGDGEEKEDAATESMISGILEQASSFMF